MKHLLVVAILMAPAAWTQTLKARELFYTPPPDAAKPAPAPTKAPEAKAGPPRKSVKPRPRRATRTR